jgi:predicted house-cleaning NTP pyrophosphatase (Maf/HAM1 superfamily)
MIKLREAKQQNTGFAQFVKNLPNLEEKPVVSGETSLVKLQNIFGKPDSGEKRFVELNTLE